MEILESVPKPASDRQWIALDTKDDRREIYHLLDRLPPKKRLAFVRWCCRRAFHSHGYSPTKPGVLQKTIELAELARWDSSASDRLSYDLFFDIVNLNRQWFLDLDAALKRLVEMVRKET